MAPDNHGTMSIDDALGHIRTSWDRLMATMSSSAIDAYIGNHDDTGWTPLDHMAHVTAWERSRRFWILGRPRHEGLGVTADEFGQGYDPLNEIVRQQTASHSYQQVMDDAHLGHQQMLDAILSFNAAARQDIGGITREESDRLGALLKENLADHYDEHRKYIERMLAS